MLRISKTKCCQLAPAAALVAFALPAMAAVNDVVPGDYFPLPEGSTTVSVYAYERRAEGPYRDGVKTMDGTSRANVMAVRTVSFFEIGGKPVSVLAVLPWSSTSLAPAALGAALGREAVGFGDLRVGAAGWLKADAATGEYLGVSAVMFVPTGSYERTQVLNIGENRYRYTLGAGWIRPLGKSFTLDLVSELAWFGDNSDYAGGHRLEQRPAYALTGHLRYQNGPNWQLYAGAQANRGGETRIDGVAQKNATDNDRLMLGTIFLNDAQKEQWILRVARDTNIQNGFKLDREVMLRYLRLF